jgi:nitrate reductase gamma subunit
MDLLSFARGVALEVATTVFVLGIVWRLVGIVLLRARRDHSAARHHDAWKGLMMTATRSWPKKEFVGASGMMEAISYTWHLALFATILFYAPHVVLLQNVVKAFLPFPIVDRILSYWPTMPAGGIFFLASVSAGLLLFALAHRLINPVKRLISNFDDYLSWFLTVTPLITGMAAYMHVGGPYQTVLAVHILSVEALMIWFPFGKLMHLFTMFAVRGVTGVLFARKGAAT